SFFFQAEDGIRDGHVTGVQTCALPILIAAPQEANAGERVLRPADKVMAPSRAQQVEVAQLKHRVHVVPLLPRGQRPAKIFAAHRSEERRVGKGCRCRWWPGSYK